VKAVLGWMACFITFLLTLLTLLTLLNVFSGLSRVSSRVSRVSRKGQQGQSQGQSKGTVEIAVKRGRMPSSCMVPRVIHLVGTAAAGQFAAYVVGQTELDRAAGEAASRL
jgi:hypothetical protein